MNASHSHKVSFNDAAIARKRPIRDAIAAAVADYEARRPYRDLVALAQSGYGR